MIKVFSLRNGSIPVPDGWVKIRVDRSSPLGNPFEIGKDGTRAEVIAKFERYLADSILKEVGEMTEDEMKMLVHLLWIQEESRKGDVALMCWCKPLDCHGDEIKKLIEKWERSQ
jgi:hypothetical protein